MGTFTTLYEASAEVSVIGQVGAHRPLRLKARAGVIFRGRSLLRFGLFLFLDRLDRPSLLALRLCSNRWLRCCCFKALSFLLWLNFWGLALFGNVAVALEFESVALAWRDRFAHNLNRDFKF